MRKVLHVIVAITVGLSLTIPALAGADPLRVDKETVKSWLGDPQVLIIDVRTGHSWDQSHRKIKGAVRHDPREVKQWAASLPTDKKIVLY
jgi:rhodanese-related sulfurtransferase